MASAAADSGDESMIVGINVTPLVDVALVLLVILMVTSSYLVSRTIPVDLPKGVTSEATPTTLALTIDKSGAFYADGVPVDEVGLRQRIRGERAKKPDLRAVIAADGSSQHRSVVKVIDLLRQEKVTRFAINVQPEDVGRKAR
jgi:biopolymer transport protein ExbD